MAPIIGIAVDPYWMSDTGHGDAGASSLRIADPTNAVLRVLAGLFVCGFAEVVMVPDRAGLAQRVKRELSSAQSRGIRCYPYLTVLGMPNKGAIEDTVVAAALMRARNIGVIVTIVGDANKSVSAALKTESADVADEGAALKAQRELEEALRTHHWNVSAVANSLGVNRSTVHRRIQRLGLVRPLKRKFREPSLHAGCLVSCRRARPATAPYSNSLAGAC